VSTLDRSGEYRGPGHVTRCAERRFFAGGALGVALLLGVGFGAHELWRDEAQAWLLARDAPSFWSLLTGEARRYEGHPFLWFGVLRLVSKLSTRHEALSTLAYVLAFANGCLILGLRQLTRWQRALVAASYFPIFEYGVLARSYALSLTCLLVALHAASSRSKYRHIVVGLGAGLAANTVIAASIPAALLIILHTAGQGFTWPGTGGTKTGAPRGVAWLGAPVTFAAWLLLARLTTPVAPDAVAQLGPLPPLNLQTLHGLGRRLVEAFLPIPELSAQDGRWWNTNVLLPDFERLPYVEPQHHTLSAVFATLGYLMALGWIVALRQVRAAAFALLAGFVAVLALFVRLPVHAVRYEGHLVLCLLVVCVLSANQRVAWSRDRFVSGMFALTFGAGVVATAVALYADVMRPFSQSRALARYLERPDARGLPIVGFEYYRLSPVAAYLGRELYAPELGRVISHGLWSRRWHDVHYESAPAPVVRRGVCWALAQSQKGTPALLVSTASLTLPPALELRMKLEASFEGSQASENYWLYRVRAGGETGVPCD
jgi:hypothetical protein